MKTDSLVTLHELLFALVTDPGSRDWTVRQLLVLLDLARPARSPATIRGLSADLRISKPAVTRAIDALEHAGFAAREADPRDRRSVLIRATPSGQRFLAGLGGHTSGAAFRAAA